MGDFEAPSHDPKNQAEQLPSQADNHVEKDMPTPSTKESSPEGEDKIISYTKYKVLKVKEYFRKLNQKDFDQLLSFDFQKQLQDNPPIDAVFSPEDELNRIKGLPREDKLKALATFKEKLVRQHEALATSRIFIERSIEYNNDVPKEKLVGLFEKFAALYGFTNQQKQIAEQLIDGFYANRKKVLEIRERYPNDVELVKELTGIDLEIAPKLKVTVGPMSIDILTNSRVAGIIYLNNKHAIYSFPYQGFATQSRHKYPIPYIVINKDRVNDKRVIAIHEYEHHKNKLFRKIFDNQVDIQEENPLLFNYAIEPDANIKRELLDTYFRLKLQVAFQQVKDEVIALKKDRAPIPYDYFFARKKRGNPYDYLAHVRDSSDMANDPLWQEIADKVLVKDYRKTFEGAVAAFDKLEKEGGYTREEVIAMLADKPLPHWQKTARRLLEQRQ